MSILTTVWLTVATGMAAGPEYELDPFGDADFAGTPLIHDTAFPTRGRAEVSLLYTSSLIDKYTTHQGLQLQLEYNFTDSLGVLFAAGFMHGVLTNIVTDERGIIGNKVTKCITSPGPDNCDNINPQVPDYRQITGVLDAAVMWSPLYGKINVVSEIDVNMQVYLLLGGGVNGTRLIKAQIKGVPVEPKDYTLSGNGLGDKGFLKHPKPHAMGGIGLQVFVSRYVAMRVDVRGIFFRDQFDFDDSKTIDADEGYWSQFWFLHAGIGIPIF